MKSAVHRGAFYYPCSAAWLQTKSQKVLMGMAILNWGMCYLSAENSQCLTAPPGGFEYGTTVVRQTSIKNPLRKGSAPGSISYETMSIRENQQPHIFFKVWSCQVQENKDCKERLSIVIEHGSLMCPTFLYCILLHSMSILKPLTKP